MTHGGSSRFVPALLMAFPALAATAGEAPAPSPPSWRSPCEVAFSPTGDRLAVTDRTASMMAVLDLGRGQVEKEVALSGRPTGLAWAPGGERVFVAEHGAGSIAEVDAAAGKVVRRIATGLRPWGVALAPGLLIVTDAGEDAVRVLDLAEGKEKARIPVLREPHPIAVTSDGKLALAGNFLPEGRADEPAQAAAMTLIDLAKLERVADVRLPPGSTGLSGICLSPDGRWAYAVHTLGRTQVPTTQLDRGWVNTNALSIVDLRERRLLATVLLDHPMEGAADPWGAVTSGDGARLWVSLAGIHQVARIDLRALHQFIDGKPPEGHRLAKAEGYAPGTEPIWLRIKQDPRQRSELVNDLAALHGADLIEKIKVQGRGPRGIALSPDGRVLAVASYYSGEVDLLDAGTGKARGTIRLGPARDPDPARAGEAIFHDATYCFQHWMSCSTCHPEARVDGMNWDLLNDGIGNPKNVRSLLYSYRTPPAMSQGVRSSMEEAVKAGFIHILFHRPEEPTLQAVEAYLKSLEPEPSPRLLPGGKLDERARRGEALFRSPRTECSTCHPAPLLTDLKLYDVGTRGPLDQASEFDNPTLIELYRTAPYLHDGSAATLREVLVDRNKGDRHGKTSGLGKEEIEDLVEYLKSL